MSERKTVLVVDDVPENIDILRGILSPHYAVRVATSGRLALKAVMSGGLPDLILLDVMMPEMDGYEVCRILKAEEYTRQVPVIFVTTRSDTDAESQGFALGAEDYIIRPFSAAIVLARVRTHIALHDRARHFEELVQERTASLLARTRELERARLEILRRLARAGEYRDNETGQHVFRLSRYAHLMALKIGLTPVEAEQIMHASMLHDIGKIGIPDHILLKPGKLSAGEFDVIKSHCRMGAEIIGKHDGGLLCMAREVALTHHEKWDGSGYPEGILGKEIPLAGRITSIVDVFDALTSVRPYKHAWSVDSAFAYIEQQRGVSFDPELVSVFLSIRSDVEEAMHNAAEQEYIEY